MNATAPRLRNARFRIAWRLALLAIVAQFVLGFVSAGHHARLLGSGGGLVEVCTADGFVRVAADGSSVPNEGDPARLDGGTHCAICALAAHDPLPASTPDARPSPRSPPAAIAAPSLPAPLAAVFTLRPPPRAPPLPA